MNYAFTVFTRHDLAINEWQLETMHKRAQRNSPAIGSSASDSRFSRLHFMMS
jgi:hypothetical protein